LNIEQVKDEIQDISASPLFGANKIMEYYKGKLSDSELSEKKQEIDEFRKQMTLSREENDSFLKYTPYKINATIVGISDI
jgi:hypothetical protein